VVALVLFRVVEWCGSAPMLPLGSFAARAFSVTNFAAELIFRSLGPLLLLLVFYLQAGGGHSAIRDGAASLALSTLLLRIPARSGELASRIGPRPQLCVGPLLLAVGLVLLSRLEAEAPYVTGILPGVLLVALGLSTTVAPLTATVLASAPERHAGLASGVNNT